jgi:hypothetical protein
MPILASQMPFKDFAEQLKSLAPEHRAAIRQIAQQDPRYIWYSDVKFPRIIDQLELLEEQGGRRNLDYEIRRIAEEALRLLEGNELTLFVASPKYYVRFLTDLRAEWEREERAVPATYLWMQSRVGREDRRYVLFGNRPPPWQSPQLQLTPELREKLEQGRQEPTGTPTPSPGSQPARASDE